MDTRHSEYYSKYYFKSIKPDPFDVLFTTNYLLLYEFFNLDMVSLRLFKIDLEKVYGNNAAKYIINKYSQYRNGEASMSVQTRTRITAVMPLYLSEKSNRMNKEHLFLKLLRNCIRNLEKYSREFLVSLDGNLELFLKNINLKIKSYKHIFGDETLAYFKQQDLDCAISISNYLAYKSVYDKFFCISKDLKNLNVTSRMTKWCQVEIKYTNPLIDKKTILNFEKYNIDLPESSHLNIKPYLFGPYAPIASNQLDIQLKNHNEIYKNANFDSNKLKISLDVLAIKFEKDLTGKDQINDSYDLRSNGARIILKINFEPPILIISNMQSSIKSICIFFSILFIAHLIGVIFELKILLIVSGFIFLFSLIWYWTEVSELSKHKKKLQDFMNI